MGKRIFYLMQEQKSKSIFSLEDQKKITMTGVQSVDGFSDTVITLTVNGKRVTINGSKLKVTSFSQGSGNFSAIGEVGQVKFSGTKKLSRLFK